MAKIPLYGDPELLPKEVIERPTAGYMPFGASGERLPVAPVKPDDGANVAHLPGWLRRPGQAWSQASFREAVLAWLSKLVKREGVTTWKIEELLTTHRGGKYTYPVLRVTLTLGSQKAECGLLVPPDSQIQGSRLTASLALLEASLLQQLA